jgi:uncharacterized protein YbjT (DUF2867 family)
MSTAKKIAVAGATGRVGRHLVDILEAQGHEVAAISRSRGVDVITGEGLAEALVGAEAIVDAATGPSPDEHAATEFFTTATRNLQREGQRAGVQRSSSCRSSAATASRRLRRREGRPRAGLLAARSRRACCARAVPRVRRAAHGVGRRGDVTYVPKMRTQLVAARTVAEALADLATASGARPRRSSRSPGRARRASSRWRRLLAARRGDARASSRGRPGDPAQSVFASGGLLPGPGAILAGPTFEAWLDEAA